ncbi:MAG: tRNA pseudouridine(55) synthase TruB [Spirochaetaceae bacterium]|jgi:tRNA pseudouridine55 synthase|nr:tRNA pseudouridine(55) synthase TruB [Spirochaetaceae bacterium]
MAQQAPSGILLYAKPPDITSFTSLSVIKKALGTKKVGHTGTLDSFADGLLVVLVGSLTRLVPHITALDKTYRALIRFGTETDTLDPTGRVVTCAPLPAEAAFLGVLPGFLGTITQVPPVYSAIHIGGKRASDIARKNARTPKDSADCGGHTPVPVIPPRQVTIRELTVLDFTGGTALIQVRCSKGTYIRSLARDLAHACGSAAHLTTLTRSAVGDFRLDEAVSEGAAAGDTEAARIRSALLPLTPALAARCGLDAVTVREQALGDFRHGKAIRPDWFQDAGGGGHRVDAAPGGRDMAVFTAAGDFTGVLRQNGDGWTYGFVVPC